MRSGNLKNILLKNKAYVHIRYSSFFLRLWLLLRPRVRAKLKSQKKYYSGFIKNLKADQHIVFDIGANEGFVSEIFLEKKIGVVAVEPDTRNISILMRRFLHDEKFHLFPNAAGSKSGTKEFYMQKSGTAFSTLNPKWKELIEKGGYRFHLLYNSFPEQVQLITIDQLIKIHGTPSFVKIDVEGYEVEVMMGMSKKIPLITFEANLPEFIEETFACIEHLHQVDNDALFNYSSSFCFGSDQFLRYDDFKRILPSIKDRTVDIICVMSNYFDYYNQLPICK